MPTPAKPCDGRFNEELQVLLTRNRNREQWGVYPCELCGASVGAVEVRGKWVPEQHWPSVTSRRHQRPSSEGIAQAEIGMSLTASGS